MNTHLNSIFRTLADNLSSRAAAESTPAQRAELKRLAECYSELAQQQSAVDYPTMNAAMERRSVARTRILKRGLIVLSERAPKLECTLRSTSERGATLQVSTTLGLPQCFDLVAEGVVHRCRSRWRTDNKMGVLFEPLGRSSFHATNKPRSSA
jgi:hypothetical protein